MTPELSLMESWRVEIKNIVVDVEKKMAVTWSDHYCRLKGRREYLLEFVYMLEMDGSGETVEKVVSFIDTSECLKFMVEKEEVVREWEGR